MKKLTIIFSICLFALGVVVTAYLGGTPKTVPKITLSYFNSNEEIAAAIGLRLQQEIQNEKNFWFGIEPEKNNHFELARALKNEIEKSNGKFDHVYLDRELRLSEEQIKTVPQAEIIAVKSEWPKIIKQLQDSTKKYYLITASIYSTSLLKDNPIHKMKNEGIVWPTTFSSGYFSINTEDEKNQLFPCNTENREGIAEWSCGILNKSRSQRRKFNPNKKMIVSSMDLTGEKDYMVLLR